MFFDDAQHHPSSSEIHPNPASALTMLLFVRDKYRQAPRRAESVSLLPATGGLERTIWTFSISVPRATLSEGPNARELLE